LLFVPNIIEPALAQLDIPQLAKLILGWDLFKNVLVVTQKVHFVIVKMDLVNTIKT